MVSCIIGYGSSNRYLIKAHLALHAYLITGLTMDSTFAGFLEHVMHNFDASYPYGLSKTEVTRLTFLAWCMKEASIYETAKLAEKV